MLILYRIYQVIVMIPVLVVATIITALLTSIGSMLGGGRWWGYYPARLWSKLFCLLTFVRVTVHGRENIDKRTSYVFVANHQGAYDIFAIYGYLNHNFRWMMKQGLRKIPFVGYACEKGKQIFVDDSTPSALRATMAAAEAQLKGGMSLVVFPEGSRTLDGRIHRFKRGAFMLAGEFNLPVVPLTIDGSYDVLQRNKAWPHWGHIILTIHRPIEPDPTEGHDMTGIINGSFDAISSALPERNRARQPLTYQR